MAADTLLIGETAAKAGVSVDTVRYYEKLGILASAARTAAGYRRFTPESVERIRFIKHAQEIGFSLEEVGTLLRSGGADRCSEVSGLLRRKISEMDEQIRRLRHFRKDLVRHLDKCESELEKHPDNAVCPVLTTLQGASHRPQQNRRK